MPHYPTQPLIPPVWLKGGNLQTLYAKSLQAAAPPYRRELIADSYGSDRIAYDFIDADRADAPCLVLLHGLEGSSRSHYAVSLMQAVRQAGWHGVVVHFRSCGGVPSKRLYHSGDTREIAHSFRLLAQRYAVLYAAGVSMGGNVLAKYLGEQGQAAIPAAAASVSTPLDLSAGAQALGKGLARALYTPYFLRTLLDKVPHPPPHAIRDLKMFDDLYTAPIHGFADAEDYYARASAKPYLPHIRIPTLLVNARNDPFFPPPHLPREHEVSPSVYLLQPEHGGHAGFVGGTGRGHLNWLPQTLLAFFRQHGGAGQAA